MVWALHFSLAAPGGRRAPFACEAHQNQVLTVLPALSKSIMMVTALVMATFQQPHHRFFQCFNEKSWFFSSSQATRSAWYASNIENGPTKLFTETDKWLSIRWEYVVMESLDVVCRFWKYFQAVFMYEIVYKIDSIHKKELFLQFHWHEGSEQWAQY